MSTGQSSLTSPSKARLRFRLSKMSFLRRGTSFRLVCEVYRGAQETQGPPEQRQREGGGCMGLKRHGIWRNLHQPSETLNHAHSVRPAIGETRHQHFGGDKAFPFGSKTLFRNIYSSNLIKLFLYSPISNQPLPRVIAIAHLKNWGSILDRE